MKNGRGTFFIDTGADLSLIKSSCVAEDVIIHFDKVMRLVGIDTVSTHQYTQGSCNLLIKLNKPKKFITHQFQVVPDNFKIASDGIIGNDLLKLFLVNIDYRVNKLRFGPYFIPIYFSIRPNSKPDIALNQIFTQPKPLNSIKLEPRTKTVIRVKISNPNIKIGICEQKEILKGVILPRAILKTDSSNNALITVLNTTTDIVELDEQVITLEPLESESNLFCISSNLSKNIKNRSEIVYDDIRFNQLLDILDLKHLNDEEKSSLVPCLSKFQHIFHLEGENLTCTDTITHDILTSENNPIRVKNYRYPEKLKSEVNKQVSEMLEQNIISPSNSPWNSPVWIVPKKTGKDKITKWRVVIDYRSLNNITVGDSYPLPSINEIFDQLGKAKYFTTLDFNSGFHQIKVSQSDKAKTAFSTPFGHYEFNRMPFGLKNAPATFQRLMDNVLSGLQGLECFVYMDDIVIHAPNLQLHTKRLKDVFTRISQHNLKLKPSKCEFLRKEIIYLGHTLSEDGCRPSKEKVEAILNYQPNGLTNTKQIQEFMGMAGYYRRFIENFSDIAQPLYKLLQKSVRFVWGEEQKLAYETLKSALVSDLVLIYPDFNKQFYLTTDASNYAIGGVLSQKVDNDLRPISYFSKSLSKSEQNYAVIEKETYAIISSMEHFRPYIYGSKFKIIIATDHKPLIWLFNVKNQVSRLLRWRLRLQEYDYEVQYIPGKSNLVADALSRDNRHLIDFSKNVPIHEILSDSESNIDDMFNEFLLNNLNNNIINHNIKYNSGSLFEAQNNFAHCISKDFRLSKGIALDIKLKFPEVMQLSIDKTYSEIGSVIIQKINDEKFSEIYHLVTKGKYFEKPTYKSLFESLVNLKKYLLSNNIKELNIPKIGSGCDKLNWNFIESMLKFIFSSCDIVVNVYTNKQTDSNKINILNFSTLSKDDESEVNNTSTDIIQDEIDQGFPSYSSNDLAIDYFSEFLDTFNNSTITNENIFETNDNIDSCNDPIAVVMSSDLNFLENNYEYLDKFELEKHIKTSLTPGNIYHIEFKNKHIYLPISKENYWNCSTYENLFHLLIKLKNRLVKDKVKSISIPKFGHSYDNLKWNLIKEIIKYVFINSEIKVNLYLNKIITPLPEEINDILTEMHSDPISGHSGVSRTLNRVKQKYKWLNMRKDIMKFIESCKSCQLNKRAYGKNRAPMELTTTSVKSMEKIFLDIVGPLPVTESGNRFLLTAQDDLSKFSFAFAIPDHQASTIAKLLVNNIFTKFGIPKIILTDQGTDFKSNLIRDITKFFKVKHQLCTAYHPQTNGALERSHATIANYLRHYIQENQLNWDLWIDLCIFSYNTSEHTSTKYTPYELMFGQKPNIPSNFYREPQFSYTYDDYVTELKFKINQNFSQARQNILVTKEKEKQHYDKKSQSVLFKVGDMVYLSNDMSRPNRAKKLSPAYTGPYKIVEQNSPVNFTIQISNKRTVMVHSNRLKISK